MPNFPLCKNRGQLKLWSATLIPALGQEGPVVRSLGYRPQRTLARPVSVRGVGFITGAPVTVRFVPAPPDSGIRFQRIDRPQGPTVPATVHQVTGTQRRTTLGDAYSGITLVEHILAALAGLRIDNCCVELDAGEPPGLDGSSQGFVAALLQAGIIPQQAPRAIWTVSQPIILQRGDATLAIHPHSAPTLRISYRLDYGHPSPIPPHLHSCDITPERFAAELAHCRTFIMESEVQMLWKQGIGRHLTHADLLVFGPRGPIHNTLKHADEPARHKVLDLVGDLGLCGCDLVGHVVAYRSGHQMNVELAKQIVEAIRQGESTASRSAA